MSLNGVRRFFFADGMQINANEAAETASTAVSTSCSCRRRLELTEAVKPKLGARAKHIISAKMYLKAFICGAFVFSKQKQAVSITAAAVPIGIRNRYFPEKA